MNHTIANLRSSISAAPVLGTPVADRGRLFEDVLGTFLQKIMLKMQLIVKLQHTHDSLDLGLE